MKIFLIGLFCLTQTSIVFGAKNLATLTTTGKVISDEMIRKEYEGIDDSQRLNINQDLITRRTIVQNAINAELLIDSAMKAGLDKSPEYKKEMERHSRFQLMNSFLSKAVEPKLTNSNVKDFYQKNKAFFDTSQVCAHHILLKDEAEAKKITELARKDPKGFETLAQKYSLDQSAKSNKGNLGCFAKNRMAAEFSAAAFNMRKNEVKGPVQSPYGFHVIRVNDIKPGKIPGYDEIESQVKETYRLRLTNELIEDLRKKAKVEINQKEVDEFKI